MVAPADHSRHPPVRSAKHDVQEGKHAYGPLAACRQRQARRTRADEIASFKLLETSPDHSLGSIKAGDSGRLERMALELRQEPERNAIAHQGKKENVEFTGECVRENCGQGRGSEAVTPKAISDQRDPRQAS